MNSDKNKVIRIEEVTLGIDEPEELLYGKICDILQIPVDEIVEYMVARRNIDSRKKTNILFVYSLDVRVKKIEKIKVFDSRHRVRIHEPYEYLEPKLNSKINKKIIIVGSGPCGMFTALMLARAGLKPVLIERGRKIEDRVEDVAIFSRTGQFNANSNIQFGEGGAGTFSDGKLYTLINDPRTKYLFSELIKAGAPEEIAWIGTPHIGTNRLREVVKNIRMKIIELGGEIQFETKFIDFKVNKNKISSIIVQKVGNVEKTNDARKIINEEIKVDDLVLAIGHSARDTYQMLYERKILMRAKAFAVGLRIEHSATLINSAQFGTYYNHKNLGLAKYKLVEHTDIRPVYTFCMCPGGYVMGATSEIGAVVTNGMSEYNQSGVNSNSALLVPVTPDDFSSDHPLAGIEFQRKYEKKAYIQGGSNYFAPAQLVGDFLKARPSSAFKDVRPSYRPGVKLTSLDKCLPDYVLDSIRQALPKFNNKIKGFARPDAVLTGVETRSSSPVRIERDEKLEANIAGIYPAGEGAGHAGGIVSSALDGIKIAEAIIEKYNNL